MTKSDELDLVEALQKGSYLRKYAMTQGYTVAQTFLTLVVKAQNDRYKDDIPPKQTADDMTINFHMMINTFMQSLLRTVQKTDELIAATGLLTSEGIPWDRENFEPEEIFAEADRLLREAYQAEP